MARRDVFVDTAGLLALWNQGDQYHRAAVSLRTKLARQGRHFVTTDYVADETATLLLIRHSHPAAADFLDTLERSQAIRLEWIDSGRFHRAATWFRKHADKEWSFTDCVSFVIMRELEIRDAFTTDHHFRQAGFAPLLKA